MRYQLTRRRFTRLVFLRVIPILNLRRNCPRLLERLVCGDEHGGRISDYCLSRPHNAWSLHYLVLIVSLVDSL